MKFAALVLTAALALPALAQAQGPAVVTRHEAAASSYAHTGPVVERRVVHRAPVRHVRHRRHHRPAHVVRTTVVSPRGHETTTTVVRR